MSVSSSAPRRLSLRLLFLQWCANAGLLLAGALWLEIPDSHIWELLLSLLLGVAIVAGFFALHATVMRRLRAASDGWPLWLGAALLAVWAGVLYLPSVVAAWWSPQINPRASYWNSQLSPSMRAILTYERLGEWQVILLNAAVWFVVPALLLPFVVETVARGVGGGSWRAGVRVLGQWRYWASCLLTGVLLYFVLAPLVDWRPAHSVRGEVVSVAVRLGILYVVTVVLVTVLVAVTSALLAPNKVGAAAGPQPLQDDAEPVLLDE